MSAPWWQSAVVYQIYPRSFSDGNRDGVGDLSGITERLEYLRWIGIDAIWLSPFYVSPMRDFGYDVANHVDVDPVFGTLEDFDTLVAAAHALDIRVLIDFVPAHTSSDHAWFGESRAGRDAAKRDWYVWRDPAPDGGPPNNWRAAFAPVPAWTLDADTGQYYLHSFLPGQPDLNWANPEVRAAMHGVLRFWLERGVDGFRADVVHNIAKPEGLPDLPDERAHLPIFLLNDAPAAHEYLREIRALLDGYPGERMMVGEISLSTRKLARYYGRGDQLHLAFDFAPLLGPWRASDWRGWIARAQEVLDPIDAWPTWVLSNHDQARHRTRYGSEARARAAAVLLLTLRGTPFMYMGEELGLEDAVVPPERVVDPGGRDGSRAPLPWDASANAGWGDAPWLPLPPDSAALHADAQRADPGSVLHLYRRLLELRHRAPALRHGSLELLDAPDDVLAYRRRLEGDEYVIAICFADTPRHFALPGAWTVELSSDAVHDPDSPYSGELAGSQALVLGRES